MTNPLRKVVAVYRDSARLLEPPQRHRTAALIVFGGIVAALDGLALLLLVPLLSVLAGATGDALSSQVIASLGLADASAYEQALVLAACVTGLFILRSILSVIGAWWSYTLGAHVEVSLVTRLVDTHVNRSHLERIGRNSADAVRNITQSANQASSLVGQGITAAADFMIMVVLGGVVVAVDPVVGGGVLLYVALASALWIRGVRGLLRRAGDVAQSMSRSQIKAVAEGEAAAKELDLRGRGQAQGELAIGFTLARALANRTSLTVMFAQRYVFESVLLIGVLVLMALAYATGSTDDILVLLGLVAAAGFRMLPALSRILQFVNQVQYLLPAVTILQEDLQDFPAGPDTERGKPSTEGGGLELTSEPLLEVRRVTLIYGERNEPALTNVSMRVQTGEAVGVVGPTGAGKSSLLDIILGLVDPTEGSVLVHGQLMKRCRTAWQRRIGYVGQDTPLLDDSIAANVALGWWGADIDTDRVWQCLRDAALDDFVMTLPSREQTVVGERGVRLSGGQRQRIGLARALYVQPEVLVLDEATSSLDTRTEASITARIEALAGKLTTITVAHRLSTIRNCDRIILIDGGEVKAEGSWDDLILSDEGFRAFAASARALDDQRSYTREDQGEAAESVAAAPKRS